MKLIFILVLSFYGLQAVATPQIPEQTILISDIDDTIQDTQIKPGGPNFSSHVAHYWHLLVGTLKSHDAYVGISSLYTALAANGIDVRYVSGAPRSISFLPEKFLQTSGFPVGELSVRPNLEVSTEEFKVSKIQEIMEENPQAKFLLIGDNGERDVSVYQRLKQDPRFADRIVSVYIHDLYPNGIGMELSHEQKPYITSADLAVHLFQTGYLSEGQTLQVLKSVEEGLNSKFAHVKRRALPGYIKIKAKDLLTLSELSTELNSPDIKNHYDNLVNQLWNRTDQIVCPRTLF
jgi:phosphatidate phosphatase APP1